MVDAEFFSTYKKAQGKPEGIPGVTMNQPLTINAYSGTIGLELEVEARNALPRDGHLDFSSPTTRTRWQSVADGSLRGEAREYIFSQPCKREEVSDMVKRLFKVFNDLDCRVQNSNRCSTHVHINMTGKTINQLTSIIALWGTFEEMLIAWHGEERVTNHFCLSMKNSTSLVDAWNSFLRTGAFEGMGQDRHGLKYMAFNILPLWRKGSFEFRCGGAPDDPEKVIKWATFLDKLCDFASSRYPIPTHLAGDLSERGGAAILKELCGEDHANMYSDLVGDDVDLFNDRCLDGFRTVQPIVLGYPWEVWMDLINKVYVPDPFARPKRVSRYAVVAPNEIPRLQPLSPETAQGQVFRHFRDTVGRGAN